MISYHKTPQNTDRIARTVFNVAVCRAFLRSVLSIVYRPPGTITDRSRKYRPLIDRTEMLLFSGCSMPLLTLAVEAVDVFLSLGALFLCVYPCAERQY
jgi:hypothetical protein